MSYFFPIKKKSSSLEDVYEDSGKFKIINSSGVGDSGDQNAEIEGYYITSKGKLYFKKIWNDKETFIVKGKISKESKQLLNEKIEDKFQGIAEFD